jgi:membrane-associated phospholipid phosphatase
MQQTEADDALTDSRRVIGTHDGTKTQVDLDSSVFREAIRFAFRPTRRNLLHWASWALALGVELALMVVLSGGKIFGWERSVTREFQRVPGRQVVFDVTSMMTNTISMPFLAIFLAIVLTVLLLGHRGAAILLVLTFPLHVLAQFPKALVDRPRPSPAFDGIVGVGGLQSFPSGHSEYVVTFYGFLAYLLMLHVRQRRARVAIFAGWVVFALATGFGRIALGRHWPLDVLTSYLIGLGLLSGLVWLHTSFRYVKADRVGNS